MNDTTIKNKQLIFKHKDIEFNVQIQYDTSKFGDGAKSFWQIQLNRVDGKRLTIPLTYKYVQHQGRLLQIPKFKKHSYICSTRRKEIEHTINLYPVVKERIFYQWFNQKAIFKYQAQINSFKFFIERKYQQKLTPLKEQKRELKQKLKVGEIDNKQYQKLYTPIRKKIDEIEHHIWNICYTYNKRYFEFDKLKPIYRVA